MFGLNIYYYIQGFNGQVIHSEHNDLIAGQVAPVKGLPGDTYNFTVEVVNGNERQHRLSAGGQWRQHDHPELFHDLCGDGRFERHLLQDPQ